MNYTPLRQRIVVLSLFAFICSWTFAQVPSVPRQQSKSRSTSSSNNTVWGTPYDYLSRRYLRYSDISEYDRGQIRFLKNSIYARHGRRFKDDNLRYYFNNQSWYRPWRNEVPSSELNKYEIYNINFLKNYE